MARNALEFTDRAETERPVGPATEKTLNHMGMCHQITQTPVPIQIQINRPTPEL